VRDEGWLSLEEFVDLNDGLTEESLFEWIRRSRRVDEIEKPWKIIGWASTLFVENVSPTLKKIGRKLSDSPIKGKNLIGGCLD
jgi:hypothetical protein